MVDQSLLDILVCPETKQPLSVADTALLDRLVKGELPPDLAAAVPVFPADAKGMATRAASGKVLSALADVMPELWGGSADLA